MRAKSKFARRFKLIWAVQSSREKYFVSVFQKYVICSRHLTPRRGAARDRHERWVWDAVDAAMSRTPEIAGRLKLVSGQERRAR
jgi:hypothetical protein